MLTMPYLRRNTIFDHSHNAIYASHTMPFMRWNTICNQICVNPQLGYLRLQRMPILPSQCHLCKMRMPFWQTMPFVHVSQCHLCTQCQLCAQCHLCMLHNANYASGAQLALLHIWHCVWHCVMLYYAIPCNTIIPPNLVTWETSDAPKRGILGQTVWL